MKKVGNGFGFRLAQSIICLIATIIFLSFYIYFNPGKLLDYINPKNGKSYYDYSQFQTTYYQPYALRYDGDDLNLYKLYSDRYNSYYEYAGKLRNDLETDKILVFELTNGSMMFLDYSDIKVYSDWSYFHKTAVAYMIMALVMAAILILEVIFTFVGRKSLVANSFCIALNLILSFCPLGLCGLIGGIKGGSYLKFQSQLDLYKSRYGNENLNDVKILNTQSETDNAETVQRAENVNSNFNEAIAINAKQGEVNSGAKKSEKICFIIICVVYAVFLIMGIIGMAAPSSGILWSSSELIEYQVEALNFITGLAMLGICMTVGLPIAFKIMLEKGKKPFLITIGVTAAAMIIMDIVFFVVKALADDGGYDWILQLSGHTNGNINDGLAITLALILSQVGITGMYFLKFLHINPDAISKIEKKVANAGERETGKFGSEILNFILGAIKAILRFRVYHDNAFYCIGTFMLTFGVFVSIYVIIVLIVLLIIGGLLILFGKYGVETTPRVYSVYDNGSNRTLKYDGYYLGRDRFVDDIGGVWYSDDGCRSFYRE